MKYRKREFSQVSGRELMSIRTDLFLDILDKIEQVYKPDHEINWQQKLSLEKFIII